MSKEVVPFTGVTEALPGLDLRAMRRSVLEEGGLVQPRQRYASKEERKVAAKVRSKARRETRKQYLASQGLGPKGRPELTPTQKKSKSKELRRMRNLYLRSHPEEARAIGIDIGRLRV